MWVTYAEYIFSIAVENHFVFKKSPCVFGVHIQGIYFQLELKIILLSKNLTLVF